jgi:hypothetical protein
VPNAGDAPLGVPTPQVPAFGMAAYWVSALTLMFAAPASTFAAPASRLAEAGPGLVAVAAMLLVLPVLVGLLTTVGSPPTTRFLRRATGGVPAASDDRLATNVAHRPVFPARDFGEHAVGSGALDDDERGLLSRGGLHAALATLVADCPAEVILSLDVPERPPLAAAASAYRTADAALADATRRGATAVLMSAVLEDGVLDLQVDDNGPSPAGASRRERFSCIAREHDGNDTPRAAGRRGMRSRLADGCGASRP